jgi:hypothetical protein
MSVPRKATSITDLDTICRWIVSLTFRPSHQLVREPTNPPKCRSILRAVIPEDKVGTFSFFAFHRPLIVMFHDKQDLESGCRNSAWTLKRMRACGPLFPFLAHSKGLTRLQTGKRRWRWFRSTRSSLFTKSRWGEGGLITLGYKQPRLITLMRVWTQSSQQEATSPWEPGKFGDRLTGVLGGYMVSIIKCYIAKGK